MFISEACKFCYYLRVLVAWIFFVMLFILILGAIVLRNYNEICNNESDECRLRMKYFYNTKGIA